MNPVKTSYSIDRYFNLASQKFPKMISNILENSYFYFIEMFLQCMCYLLYKAWKGFLFIFLFETCILTCSPFHEVLTFGSEDRNSSTGKCFSFKTLMCHSTTETGRGNNSHICISVNIMLEILCFIRKMVVSQTINRQVIIKFVVTKAVGNTSCE